MYLFVVGALWPGHAGVVPFYSILIILHAAPCSEVTHIFNSAIRNTNTCNCVHYLLTNTSTVFDKALGYHSPYESLITKTVKALSTRCPSISTIPMDKSSQQIYFNDRVEHGSLAISISPVPSSPSSKRTFLTRCPISYPSRYLPGAETMLLTRRLLVFSFPNKHSNMTKMGRSQRTRGSHDVRSSSRYT